MLVRPEDMLEAVRASMLLGAVLPEMRNEVDVLALDLAELVRLTRAIASDRDVLARELADLHRERERLRPGRGAAKPPDRDGAKLWTRARAGPGAWSAGEKPQGFGRARERDATAAKHGTEDAHSGDARSRERVAALAPSNPARLAPKIPFTQARGLLPRPVSGETARAFGSPDGYGGTTRGVSIIARRQAIVSSPSDGRWSSRVRSAPTADS